MGAHAYIVCVCVCTHTYKCECVSIYIYIVSMSLTQFAEICIVICRGWSSNLGHPTYSPWKRWIPTTRWLETCKSQQIWKH